MRADNSHHLIAAARNRSEAARQRATAAVRRMDATGIPITFESVAREARVSRSWLYANPALRAEIERLRTPARLPRPAVPIRQRASDDSLRTRLQAAVDRVRVLEAENRQIRQALAHALGERREAETAAPQKGHGTRRS